MNYLLTQLQANITKLLTIVTEDLLLCGKSERFIKDNLARLVKDPVFIERKIPKIIDTWSSEQEQGFIETEITRPQISKAINTWKLEWLKSYNTVDYEYAKSRRRLDNIYEKSYALNDFKVCNKIQIQITALIQSHFDFVPPKLTTTEKQEETPGIPLENLTKKQKKFVQLYDGNGFKAAKGAGYKGSDATLRVVASQNLTKLNIIIAMQNKFSDEDSERIMSKKLRGAYLTQMAKSPHLSVTERKDCLDKLSKMGGDYIKKIEHSGPDGLPITTTQVDFDKLADENQKKLLDQIGPLKIDEE